MAVDITKIDYNELTRIVVFSEEKTATDVVSLASILIMVQRWEFEKISTSSIINQSILGHIERHYTKMPLSINGNEFIGDFSSFISNKAKKDDGSLIFCIGNSGCGKSTLLTKTFLDLSEQGNVLPIYINLNNATKFSCNKLQILRTVCSRYKIYAEDIILNVLLNNYKFVFLLDGLDEKSSRLKYSSVEKSINLKTDDTFVIACRINAFNQLKLDGIDSVFEFRPIDKKVRFDYFNNFFPEDNEINRNIKKVSDVILDSHQDNDIFSNILMLTLLAIHMKESPDYILQLNRRRGTIVDSIAMATIVREIKKNKIDIPIDTCSKIIESVAFSTYERQQKGQTFLYDAMIKNAKRKLQKVDLAVIEKIANIFITRLGNTKTYRFIHAQFYDFFVAKAFFNAIKKNRNRARYLAYNSSIDINAFLSDLMRDNNPLEIYNKLERLCYKYLNEISIGDSSEDQNVYGRLFLLVMHMQRTGEYAKVYNFAKGLLDSGEKFLPFVENLILHSKVIGGLKDEDEDLYFQKLLTDDEFLTWHMGVVMLYYNEELELRLPYYDDGKVAYKGVFYAYSRHFLRSDIKHYYIVRRHNIFVIRTLLKKRGETPQKVADFYKSIKSAVESDNSTFGLKVKREYELLIETIDKYPVTSSDYF